MSRDLWGAFVSQGSVTAGSPTITGVTDFSIFMVLKLVNH